MVDECEGCMNVGDVRGDRPKQVLTNTQHDSALKYNDEVY